jgi:hypothetical protein
LDERREGDRVQGAVDVGERVRAIIAAAESMADALVAERRARISELSDAIVAKAESVLAGLEAAEALTGRLDEVVEQLQEAAARLEAEAAGSGAAIAPGGEATRTRRPTRFVRQGERGELGDEVGAGMVALQMAMAGGRRGEVEAHLRRAFDLDDPEAILDHVYGEGTPADALLKPAGAERGPRP